MFDLNTCRFKFENLKKYKDQTIIFNLASEHWGEQSLAFQLHNDLKENDFDFWILSHHPGDHKKLERLIYYPWWYIYSKNRILDTIDIKKSRQFDLGCLHGNPRPHRIINYFALKDKFPNEKICSTMHDQYPLPWRKDDLHLTSDEQARWESIRSTYPDKSSIKSNVDLNLPALADSYLYLVPETTVVDRIFITEKTWKPIASGQLFLIFGNPGTIAHLRNLGVDTFDDIIDHSYDLIKNCRDRLDLIHNVIKDLLRQDLKQIWDDTYERRKENRRKFFSGEFMFYDRVPFDDILEKSYVPLGRTSSLDAE